jgi:hypothetical protein
MCERPDNRSEERNRGLCAVTSTNNIKNLGTALQGSFAVGVHRYPDSHLQFPLPLCFGMTDMTCPFDMAIFRSRERSGSVISYQAASVRHRLD